MGKEPVAVLEEKADGVGGANSWRRQITAMRTPQFYSEKKLREAR